VIVGLAPKISHIFFHHWIRPLHGLGVSIPFVQIPTTLLAQVDSSIGGKVAIDLPQAKNLVGAFYQPKAVICDMDVLKTLPKSEMLNGLGEIVKYGLIYKNVKGLAIGDFFKEIQKNIKGIKKLKKGIIENIIYKCAKIKARVVEIDEFDAKDTRIILNLGHTFAHALESHFGYSKKYTHGQCVALGIVLAAQTSYEAGYIKCNIKQNIIDYIKTAGLLSLMPKGIATSIIKLMSYDKKFVKGKTRFVLPSKEIGKVLISEIITGENLRNAINKSE
jgi:3-dehydroquinate synthase